MGKFILEATPTKSALREKKSIVKKAAKKMNKKNYKSLAIEDFQKDNNIAFGILLKIFYYTRKFVLEKQRGNLEDAEDVFQDALIILYEKLYDDHFKAYTCLANYVNRNF